MIAHLLSHHHSRLDSPVHRLPPGLKLGAAFVIILGTVLVPLPWVAWFAGVAALLILTAALSRLPPLFLLKRLLLLSPFVLGVALANALQSTGPGHWLTVAMRSGLCLLTVILVSNTTAFSKILRVLQLVRVPALLVATLALMHRYLFVLADEAERMRRARASRTFARGHRLPWSTLATVVSQLFIRASERADRIYAAMGARGWK